MADNPRPGPPPGVDPLRWNSDPEGTARRQRQSAFRGKLAWYGTIAGGFLVLFALGALFIAAVFMDG
jgi:hypothetical protein